MCSSKGSSNNSSSEQGFPRPPTCRRNQDLGVDGAERALPSSEIHAAITHRDEGSSGGGKFCSTSRESRPGVVATAAAAVTDRTSQLVEDSGLVEDVVREWFQELVGETSVVEGAGLLPPGDARHNGAGGIKAAERATAAAAGQTASIIVDKSRAASTVPMSDRGRRGMGGVTNRDGGDGSQLLPLAESVATQDTVEVSSVHPKPVLRVGDKVVRDVQDQSSLSLKIASTATSALLSQPPSDQAHPNHRDLSTAISTADVVRSTSARKAASIMTTSPLTVSEASPTGVLWLPAPSGHQTTEPRSVGGSTSTAALDPYFPLGSSLSADMPAMIPIQALPSSSSERADERTRSLKVSKSPQQSMPAEVPVATRAAGQDEHADKVLRINHGLLGFDRAIEQPPPMLPPSADNESKNVLVEELIAVCTNPDRGSGNEPMLREAEELEGVAANRSGKGDAATIDGGNAERLRYSAAPAAGSVAVCGSEPVRRPSRPPITEFSRGNDSHRDQRARVGDSGGNSAQVCLPISIRADECDQSLTPLKAIVVPRGRSGGGGPGQSFPPRDLCTSLVAIGDARTPLLRTCSPNLSVSFFSFLRY